MAGQFPNSTRFEVIDKTKLLPHEERPEAVVAAVRAFLGT
jgi:hypothetical protein